MARHTNAPRDSHETQMRHETAEIGLVEFSYGDIRVQHFKTYKKLHENKEKY